MFQHEWFRCSLRISREMLTRLSGEGGVQVLAGRLFLILLLSAAAAAQTIRVSGNWILSVDTMDLESGAGSDFPDFFESAADQAELTVKGKKVQLWQVDVSITGGAAWHSDLALWARRTSDGTGPGTISGGTVYQEVTESAAVFFSSGKNRNSIAIQYKLTGVSAALPAGTYTTTVVYTVTGL